MEELINKLIDSGWKPYWVEKDDIEVCSYDKDKKKISIWYMNWSSPSEWDYDWLFLSLRDITTKESWLWQFVCENELTNLDDNHIRKWEQQYRYVYDDCDYWGKSQLYSDDYDYQYRLIECALKDESELEKFLLENIKI